MTAATRFRTEAEKRYGQRRQRTHYPAELKELALQHAEEVLQRGGALTDAAQDLGVDPNSLRKWRKKGSSSAGQGKLRPMRVVADGQLPRYVVTGPADVRVECTDAQSVADLLRALR